MKRKYTVSRDADGAFSVTVNSGEQATTRAEPDAPENLPLALTASIVAANLIVWLGLLPLGVKWFDPAAAELLAWGGNLFPLTLTGDYWRLFTSLFLHAGALHLAANMAVLAMVGPRAEHWFGRCGALAIYFLGGLWAGLVAALWHGMPAQGFETKPMVVSVGASGAIMAMCGALLVAAWERMDGNGGEAAADGGFRKLMGGLIGLNLVAGFLIPVVDQAVHLGGLLAGVALGMAVGLTEAGASRIRRAFHIGAVSLLASAALLVVLHLPDRSELRQLRMEIERGDETAPTQGPQIIAD